METFYLIDFENVHNEGLENIDILKKSDHIHIFSTEKALNIRMDIVFSKKLDIEGHIVPVRRQSLDMHLVSYLGHLLGVHGKKCTYIIVSKDTDYDNIIQFWKDEGYPNISRRQRIAETATDKKKKQKKAENAANKKKKQVLDRESQIRSFFENHFKKKIYLEKKEEMINIIINAKTKQEINNGLMKLYTDGKTVKHIHEAIKPLIKDLPKV